MKRPMFIKIAEGRNVEFINVAHVVRIEIVHPEGTEPGSGKVFLDDGTERLLDGNEINWVMRMMPDLIGQPARGTQEPDPRFWGILPKA